jgi:hypothetical protein
MFKSVKYNDQEFIAKIDTSKISFKLIQDTNPEFEVEILSNQTGDKLRVYIRDLVLYPMVRSL